MLESLLRQIAAELSLPKTKHQQAEARYRTITELLAESDLAVYAPEIYPQGSMRLGTTVKPLAKNTFDLDSVMLLPRLPAWVTPASALDMVAKFFEGHGTYAGMVERRPRCVRISYADLFDLDIVPARPHTQRFPTFIEIPDRKLATWVSSNPKLYAAQFDALKTAGGTVAFRASVEPVPDQTPPGLQPPVVVCVQLVKRARDIDYQQDCDLQPASILLTTIVARVFAESNTVIDGLSRAIAYMGLMAAMEVPPTVENPSNPGENLARQWREQPATFPRFKRFANRLAQALADWQRATGLPQIASALGPVFGEPVTTSAVRSLGVGVAAASSAGALGFSPGTTKLAAFPSPGTPPVPRHTFFGG
jgi:hypothetical protein